MHRNFIALLLYCRCSPKRKTLLEGMLLLLEVVVNAKTCVGAKHSISYLQFMLLYIAESNVLCNDVTLTVVRNAGVFVALK